MAQLKDRELQDYYDGLFEMYGTPGWRMLMEDVAVQLKVLDTPRDVMTLEQLYHRRGELAQLDWLASHQTRTEYAYAHLLEEQGEDAEGLQSEGIAKVIDANAREE